MCNPAILKSVAHNNIERSLEPHFKEKCMKADVKISWLRYENKTKQNWIAVVVTGNAKSLNNERMNYHLCQILVSRII